MLGSGLGMVLRKTGVAENIVQVLMQKIGVKTQKRAVLATMVCSVVLVTLLGTLAGANAIIAPIVIPLVAAVGLTPSTLAVIFQGAGQTGLFLSPFSPPMVTLMGITGLSYPRILLCAGLPIALIMWIGTYWIALRVQKQTQGKEDFGEEAVNADTVSLRQMPRLSGPPHLLRSRLHWSWQRWWYGDLLQGRRILRDLGHDRGLVGYRSDWRYVRRSGVRCNDGGLWKTVLAVLHVPTI